VSAVRDLLTQLKEVRHNLSHGQVYDQVGMALYDVLETILEGAEKSFEAAVELHESRKT
jgi:exonuclease VII small subunit